MNADGNFLGSLDDVGKTTLKDTTSDDALRNYAIAGITAGVTAGISEYAGITEMSRTANAANTVDGTRTATQVLQNAKVSLYESAISNTTSTVVQSAVNGESPSDTLSNLALNIAVGAMSNAAAKEIGNAAHPTDKFGNALTPKISTTEQLTLHAALGCASGAAQGGDCASGAAAGVVGEITGSNLRSSVENGSMNKQTAVQLAGLSGAAASLFVSAASGASDEQTANNIFTGQRVGSNAAENNGLHVGTIVGGIVGATGAATGAYMEGEKDPKKLAVAAVVGGTIGAASGAVGSVQGVAKGIAVGSAVGAAGGTLEGYFTTILTNPNASIQEIMNNSTKGAISGAIGGAVGGGFGGAISATGASGFAAESISAMMGLGAGVSTSATTTNYNFFNTQNQTPYNDYIPKNIARTNNPTWLISPHFNAQSNYLTNFR